MLKFPLSALMENYFNVINLLFYAARMSQLRILEFKCQFPHTTALDTLTLKELEQIKMNTLIEMNLFTWNENFSFLSHEFIVGK
jgi:hypothetical protein